MAVAPPPPPNQPARRRLPSLQVEVARLELERDRPVRRVHRRALELERIPAAARAARPRAGVAGTARGGRAGGGIDAAGIAEAGDRHAQEILEPVLAVRHLA